MTLRWTSTTTINLPIVGVLSSPRWADGAGTWGASRSSKNATVSYDVSTSQLYSWPVSMITGSFRADCVTSSEFGNVSWESGPGKNTSVLGLISFLFTNSSARPVCRVKFLSLVWNGVPMSLLWLVWFAWFACSDDSVCNLYVWRHFEVCREAWRLHFDREISSPFNSRKIVKF